MTRTERRIISSSSFFLYISYVVTIQRLSFRLFASFSLRSLPSLKRLFPNSFRAGSPYSLWIAVKIF